MKNVLLMVGSPRKEASTSRSLGEYLLTKFSKEDLKTEEVYLHSSLKSEDKLLSKVNKADLVILSFPLYVDSLPAPVIKGFELIKKNKESYDKKEKQFLAICNCGFPEANHNKIALKICKQLVKEMDWKWMGSLAVGMGAAINGEKVENIEGMAGEVIEALNQIYAAVMEDEGTGELTTVEPSIPKWLYLFLGGMGWRWQAFKNGVWRNLGDKPYWKN